MFREGDPAFMDRYEPDAEFISRRRCRQLVEVLSLIVEKADVDFFRLSSSPACNM